MSLAGDAAQRTLRSGVRIRDLGGAASYRLTVYLACTVFAVAVNYALGKEMAWDTLNYHLYAGFSAVNDRFSQDYFAAGPQSYANPYVYLPFYALVRAGLPALLIGSVLAVVHSVVLWLTFELALAVFPLGDSVARIRVGAWAVVLAALNPVLLQQIGSSFADITTAALVLGGWVLLATAIRTEGMGRVIGAGLLLGAATALKPTNAVHAIAASVLVLMLARPLLVRARSLMIYAAALGLSFTVVAAPWSSRLESRFGNPFFPFLNNVFRSPEFTAEPLHHLRFIPSSLGDALWRPFAMLDPFYMVHEELMAPDARYAVLCVLIGTAAFCWLWRRNSRGPPVGVGQSPPDGRILIALGCAFAIDWVLWLAGSGNSRYFIPMACVCSVLLIGLLVQLLPTAAKARAYILSALFATQVMQLWWGAELRWNAVPWDGGKWFEIEVPAALQAEPALYLTIGTQSDSFIAPYLAKDAGLVNFSGGYPLAGTGATGAQVRALIQKYAPHLRVLTRGERLYADSEHRAPGLSEVNGALARFALRADLADCARIAVRGLPPDLEPVFVSSIALHPEPRDTSYLVSCRVIPDGTDHSAEKARQQQAEAALDHLEDACPELFQPRRLPMDTRGPTSRRLYMNTDVVAWVSWGWVKFQEPLRDEMIVLGRESDWVSNPPRLACGRHHGHYFATVLDSPPPHPAR
jgi:hypothetical protein